MTRTLRTEIPVTTTATPSSRTIKPMSCAPNSELVSEIGMTEDVATGSLPGLEWFRVPGGGWGAEEDGLIFGNRVAALPAGIVIVTPGTPEPTTGIAPMGKVAPRPLVAPGTPGVVVVEPLAVEPGEEPAPDFVLDVGLGDAGVFATVTVRALPVAVSGESLPLATETVAENLIVSPAGAAFGTVTFASICDAVGCFAGRVRSQLVLAGLLVQLPTVNTGWLNAGVFAPGVSVVAIVPSSGEVDHAEIRNRMVPPGCTLFVDAETVTAGLVAVVPLPVGVGLVVEGDGEGEDLGEAAAGLSVALAVGSDGLTAFGLDDTAGLDDAAGKDGAFGVDDATGLLDAGGLDAPVGDGVAEAGGVAAMTMPVMPPEITKRPVARPSVTGRACGDRMGHLVFVGRDDWDRALRDIRYLWVHGLPLGPDCYARTS